MTGTVIKDVLPVTTLITLVKKKIATRSIILPVGTSSSYRPGSIARGALGCCR